MDQHRDHSGQSVWISIARRFFFAMMIFAMALAPLRTVQAAPLYLVFSVNSPEDSVDSAPGNGVCADSMGRCTLRAAIMEANSFSGTDTINVPAGTFTLTLANAGGLNEDNSIQGDLDILSSMNIQGAGAASTIIQAGTNTSNGIDKVFGVNPICSGPVNVTISGVTIRYGRNSQAYDATWYSHSGGGLDFCSSGTGGTFSLSNAVVSDNTNVNYYGGGLNIDVVSPSTVTITNVQFLNNRTLHASNTANGGAINVLGVQTSLVITDSTFRGNRVTGDLAAGGAIFFGTASSGGSLQIHHSVIDGNMAGGYGGGLYVSMNNNLTTVSIDQGTQITNNTARTAGGGGIMISGSTTNPVLISEANISGNYAMGVDSGYGGGGLWIGQAYVVLQYSRIADNTTASSNGATGLRKNADAGTVMATNNWWGCSGGPGASGCDTVSIAAGTVTTSPFLQLQTVAVPATLAVGQISTITAGFGLAAANSDGLAGVAVGWSAAGGSLSAQQTSIQSNGTATASYQPTSIGPSNQVTATVDHSSASASLSVSKANSATALTSSANPGVSGETVTFTASVTSAIGLSLNGNVTFSADGTPICSNVALSGGIAQCSTSSLSLGHHAITAVYRNDANHNDSSGSIADQQILARPVISDIVDLTTNEDTAIPAHFTISDADTLAQNLNLQATSSNTTLVPNGNITINHVLDDYWLTITPAQNLSGNATITVTVTDPGGLAASDQFTLTVNPVNDPPVITEGDDPIQITMDEDGDPVGFPPTTLHATDIDSSTLTWSILSIPTLGNAFVDPSSGQVTYTPFADASGKDSFVVMVFDGELLDSILFQININAVDDYPYKLYWPILFGD